MSIRPIVHQFITRITMIGDSAFWSSILSALIGAIVALAVVFLQNNQAEKKEKATEKNKLVYLNFLINDTYNAINWYDESARKLNTSFKVNPFIIPNFPLYTIHSLNTIANKINQEEYYLAFVNQAKNKDLTEVLLLCNTIYKQYNDGSEHYKSQFQTLVREKDTLYNMLNKLNESLNEYYIKNGDGHHLIGQEAVIYKNLVSLSDSVKHLSSINQQGPDGRSNMLYESKDVLIEPLINHLNSQGAISHRQLLIQAFEAQNQYNRYVGIMYNVVEAVERNRVSMTDLVKRLQIISAPLKEYVAE